MTRPFIGSLIFSLLFVPILVASDVELSVPVKSYKTPNADRSMTMQPTMLAAPERPQPTTPGGKLPQYQLGHSRRIDESAKAGDSVLKFILALPDIPVIVEATITIDGKPFREAREARVARLVEFARSPLEAKPLAAIESEMNDELLPETKEPVAAVAQQKPAGTESEPNLEDVNDSSSPAKDEQAVDDKEAESDSEDSTEPAEEIDTTPPVAEYTQAGSVEERIRRYIAATESVPSADEIRWMLTQWVDGPVVLFLNDNFQRFRADQTPVFKILDRDRDGIVSVAELAAATDSVTECDLNRDDIVQHAEIGEVAADPRDEITHAGPGRLIYDLPTVETADAVAAALLAHFAASKSDTATTIPRFDGDGDRQLSDAEVADLQTRPADIRVQILFDTKDKAAALLKVTGVSDAFSEATETAVYGPNSLTLKLGDSQVEFSAVQSLGTDQISIGAVNDGYPMLPLIDPNDDGQLTIRELRSLSDQLARFDVNNDGTLTKEENRPTIRLCIGLGAIVHSELAGLRSIQPQAVTASISGPEWFVQMDVNKDNDLSAKEFSGNKEQFAAIDADSDDLISAEEALEYEKSLKKSE